MTQDEALKLARDALEALENISTALREDDVLGSDIELMLDAITTIRETLAQPDEDAIIIQYHEMTIKRLEQRIEELTAQTITEEHIAKVTSDIDLAVNKALAQPEQDNTYVYASSLATAIWQKHYMKDAPKWKPLDTTEGVLTQIDNMTCGLVKEKPAQPEQEPVARVIDNGTPEALKLAQIALDDIEHQRFSWRRFDALVAIKQALAQPEERNFCPRCGKRTADLTTIHTCTPPQGNT
jgi:hypothetical protein